MYNRIMENVEQQLPEQSEQPVQQSLQSSKTWILWVVVAVLVSSGLTFGATKLFQPVVQETKIIEKMELDDAMMERGAEKDEQIPPFLYAKSRDKENFFKERDIVEVDRLTGEETVVLESPEGYIGYGIIAVPQIGFDGRIFITLAESEGKRGELMSYNLFTKEPPQKVDLPLPHWDARILSPDQTKYLALYDDNLDGAKPEIWKKIMIWNLLTGEGTVIGEIAEDEYLAEYLGEGVFGGISGFEFGWRGIDCGAVYVWEDHTDESATRDSSRKKFKEIRNYCLP